MMARRFSQPAYFALKAAYGRLIEQAGGLEAAASLTRINKTTLGVCAQHTKEFHLPGDVIADLENVVGAPIVTQLLARMAGFDLVPVAERGIKPAIDPAHMGIKLMQDLGDFAKSVEEMDEDGIREPHEIRRCIAEMSEIAERAARCLEMLHVQLAEMTRAGQR